MAGRPLILLMARALAYPDDRRKTARLARLSRGLRGLLIPQAVENLRAGEEDRARAGEQQQLAAIAWIFVKISRTARHRADRSEEHTSELQSLMRISYAVF